VVTAPFTWPAENSIEHRRPSYATVRAISNVQTDPQKPSCVVECLSDIESSESEDDLEVIEENAELDTSSPASFSSTSPYSPDKNAEKRDTFAEKQREYFDRLR